MLKMQASNESPVTSITTTPSTTVVTKSREQILIQSSGAMIAVIVIGIIIILAVLLIILKTYNRRTHVSRVLGTTGSKPRQKMRPSVGQSNVPMNDLWVPSVSGGMGNSNPAFENTVQLPRAELSSVEENRLEQFSTNSGSTAVTIHDVPPLENT